MALIIKRGARKPITRSVALDALKIPQGIGGIEGKPAYIFSLGEFNCCFSREEAERITIGWQVTAGERETIALELRRAAGLLSTFNDTTEQSRYHEALAIINDQMKRLIS